jgi:hypothetical protein
VKLMVGSNDGLDICDTLIWELGGTSLLHGLCVCVCVCVSGEGVMVYSNGVVANGKRLGEEKGQP